MTIIKRDGRIEEYNRDKMRKVVMWAASQNETFANIILDSIEKKVYDGIDIKDLFDEVIRTSANNIKPIYPIYDDICRNLLLLKIYKENAKMKIVDNYRPLSFFLAKGVKHKVYDAVVVDKFSEQEIEELSNYIDYKRDYLFTYKGLYMFNKKYCKKLSNSIRELPQITYMVAAMSSFFNDYDNRIEKIKETYDLLSKHLITLGTPRILNSLKEKAQLASCVLNTPDDDTRSLNETDSNLAIYGKHNGGLAYYAGYIRSLGSVISTSSGLSDGVVPHIKRVEQTISTFNQNGTRNGACVVTFPWWHQDVMDCIMLRDAGGTEDSRARKLVYSMTFNRILFERIDNNEMITLFDPKEVPLLNETYGKEFEEAYLTYEKDGSLRKTKVLARELIYKYLKVRKETGNLYAFFADNVNELNLTGKFVNASNLCCVTGKTNILTKKGNKPISSLVNKTVECWNGNEWVPTPIFKTSNNDMVIEVELHSISDKNAVPVIIECNLYHKFYIQKNNSIKRVPTMLLRPGDILENPRNIEESLKLDVKINYMVHEIRYTNRREAMYCGYEYKTNKLIFNNIMTGNCEITVPSSPSKVVEEKVYEDLDSGEIYIETKKKAGEIGICNLLSINAYNFSNLPEKDKDKYIYNILVGADNILDTQFYPAKEGMISNRTNRPIGIGVSNYARYLAANKCKFTDDEALVKTIELFDDIYFRVYKQSSILADERGTFKSYRKSKWFYKNNENNTPLHMFLAMNDMWLKDKRTEKIMKSILPKWNSLKDNYIKHFGVRFSLHASQAPTSCQDSANKIRKNGKSITLYEYMKENGVDVESIQDEGVPKWVEFNKTDMIDTRYEPKEVNRVWYNGKQKTRTITFEDGNSYTFTYNHPLLTKDGWKTVGELTENDEILKKESCFKITKIVNNNEEIHTWDIEVPGVHEFLLSNGCISHNTSGKIINAIEGIEPIFNTFYMEEGTQVLPTIVPDFKNLANYYQKCWDIPVRTIYDLASVRQQFIDQAQSLNSYYPQDLDSAYEFYEDLKYAYNIGLKTLYYFKTPKAKEEEKCEACGS